jgi:hypothetical protein
LFVHARIGMSVLLCLLASAATADEVRWQVVNADRIKVGHAEITRAESAAVVVVDERLELRLGKTGRRVHYRIRVETESAPDGTLRRLLREVQASEGDSRIEARVTGDDLEITRGVGEARTTEKMLGVAHELRSDEFARAWLAAAGRGMPGAPLRYRSWDPVKGEPVDVELVARTGGEPGQVERNVTSARAVSASLLQVDASGNVVRELMSLGTYDFERRDAPQGEALAADGVFDHVAALLQKSPYRIPDAAMLAKIRYRFAGKPVTLPVGAGQRAWTDGEKTWIQVCASCPLDAIELPADERRRALAPSHWLESDDAQLAQRALGLTSRSATAAGKMRRLTEFVRGRMSTQVDMLGYGTALQALHSRRGDCTEYAVLLAALGRAAGVPTRIAIGRVYARHFEGYRHVFVPHAWVQAWTGTGWESFDAAIGTFDSTHLAFAVSYDGDPLTHYAGIMLSRALRLEAAARVVPKKAASD